MRSCQYWTKQKEGSQREMKKGIAIKQQCKDRIAMKKKFLRPLSAMYVRKKRQKQIFDIEIISKYYGNLILCDFYL